MEQTNFEAACTTMPIFPLPEVVLIPHTVLPIHVFEPRYVQLLNDSMAGHRYICFPQLMDIPKGNETILEQIAPIAGVGQIVHHASLPGDRFFIVLKGVGCVKIEQPLLTDKLYESVQASVILPPMSPMSKSSQDAIHLLLKSILLLAPKRSGAIREILAEEFLTYPMLNAIVGSCVRNAQVRQSYIENTDMEVCAQVAIDGLTQVLTLLHEDANFEA